MYNLFAIPAATTTIAQVTEYSAPWFTELLPVVYVAVGLAVGIGFIIFLMAVVHNAIHRLFYGPDYYEGYTPEMNKRDMDAWRRSH